MEPTGGEKPWNIPGSKNLTRGLKNAVRARRTLQLGSGIVRPQIVNLRYASSGGRLPALSSYNPRELTTARHALPPNAGEVRCRFGTAGALTERLDCSAAALCEPV